MVVLGEGFSAAMQQTGANRCSLCGGADHAGLILYVLRQALEGALLCGDGWKNLQILLCI